MQDDHDQACGPFPGAPAASPPPANRRWPPERSAPEGDPAGGLARLLTRTPPGLLRGTAQDRLAEFLGQAVICNYGGARQVLRQGDPTAVAFLVLRGGVEVSFIDEDGHRVLAHLARPGEVVGEVEILSGRPCAATCAALPGTTLARFDLPLLMRFVPAEQLLYNLADIFHDRLTRDNRQHSVAMFYASEDRIRIHLLNMTTPGQPLAHISQGDLATFCGCSRQTVNRMLAQLRDAGIVALSRGAIRVLDRPRLEAMGIAGQTEDLAAGGR